jgi:hypothetical protein
MVTLIRRERPPTLIGSDGLDVEKTKVPARVKVRERT